MVDINNNYRYVSCANGMVFCTEQMADLFYITVCGDGEVR